MTETTPDRDDELLRNIDVFISDSNHNGFLGELLKTVRSRYVELLDERDNTERYIGHLQSDRTKMKCFLGELARGQVEFPATSAAFVLTTLTRMPWDK